MDKLRKKLKERYGDSPDIVQVENFAKSMAYLCRMYWLHRTDKLQSKDYALYRELTNHFCPIEAQDKLSDDQVPVHGETPLFTGKYVHVYLEEKIVRGIMDTLISAPKKLSFWVRVKKMITAWY